MILKLAVALAAVEEAVTETMAGHMLHLEQLILVAVVAVMERLVAVVALPMREQEALA